MTSAISWTHPSVRLLVEEGRRDPTEEIERRARDMTLEGLERGWSGPPYDPFELAHRLGTELVAREDVDDARLVPADDGWRIEFNPHRRPARIRFSVAHELGHALFTDAHEQPRYRNESHEEHARPDDWQLEMLCNVAAAELLMPAGAFPLSETEDLSLPHLLDLRQRFGVSTEALLRRVVKLTERPVSLFAATRLSDEHDSFRIDYLVGSRAWRPEIAAGERVDAASVLSHCTAVGFTDEAVERWSSEELKVQAVGIPPYPGHRFPRVVGLVEPPKEGELRAPRLRYVRGDAAQPNAQGEAIIAHVVNNTARRWGGKGFAVTLLRRFPEAREEYAAWASGSGERKLGAVHLARAGKGLWIASMVAQAGYGAGPALRPRLRLAALRRCLERLASIAQERDADVHMPLIGTGQGGATWPTVRDLVLDELRARDIDVTVYVLPQAEMPQDEPDQLALSV